MVCNGSEYGRYWKYAAFCVIMYPLLLPLTFLLLLYWQRELIEHPRILDKLREATKHGIAVGPKSELATRLSMLFSNYQPHLWYFEVVEMYTKVLLTSFPSLISDENSRYIYLILLGLLDLRIRSILRPYVLTSQNILSDLGRVQILFVNFAAFVELNEGLRSNRGVVYVNENKAWYGYCQQGIVFLSVVQVCCCIYFMRERLEEQKRNATEIEVSKAMNDDFVDREQFKVCLHHGDGLSPDFSKLLFSLHRNVEVSEILRVQGILYLSLCQRDLLLRSYTIKSTSTILRHHNSVGIGNPFEHKNLYAEHMIDSTLFTMDLILRSIDVYDQMGKGAVLLLGIPQRPGYTRELHRFVDLYEKQIFHVEEIHFPSLDADSLSTPLASSNPSSASVSTRSDMQDHNADDTLVSSDSEYGEESETTLSMGQSGIFDSDWDLDEANNNLRSSTIQKAYEDLPFEGISQSEVSNSCVPQSIAYSMSFVKEELRSSKYNVGKGEGSGFSMVTSVALKKIKAKSAKRELSSVMREFLKLKSSKRNGQIY